MRVVQVPSGRVHAPPKKRKRIFAYVGAVLITGALTWNALRPLPPATIVMSPPPPPAAKTVPLAWPGYGQSSVSAEGFGLLATNGAQTPLATASIAKVITALCVLEKYPLEPGEQGPKITMTEADAALYRQQVENNGSNLYIETGEQLTEYQAIQAIMLPSANNIADSLAIWAFGSLPNYQKYATDYVGRQGMKQTTIGSDASGFDPSTRSTATDLAELGLAVQRNAVLSEIAKQKSAVFPLVGELTNYNATLASGFMTGIKTGNNDEDPGAFLYAANPNVGSSKIYITGAVMGGPTLTNALNSGESLARSAVPGFDSYTYLTEQSPVGTVKTAWGQTTSVDTVTTVQLLRWVGHASHVSYNLTPTNGTTIEDVGTLTFDSGPRSAVTKLRVTKPVAGPSLWWRVSRIPWE